MKNNPNLEVNLDKRHKLIPIYLFIMNYSGTCTGEHGVGLGKMKLLEQQYGEIGIDVMRNIKLALDPKNLMNPGKIFTM